MKLVLGILICVSFLLTGCVTTDVGSGCIFTSVKEGKSATSSTSARKTGIACAKNVFGAFAWGDASIDAAKKNGGIKKVSSVDRDVFTIFGSLYSKSCTVVKGK